MEPINIDSVKETEWMDSLIEAKKAAILLLEQEKNRLAMELVYLQHQRFMYLNAEAA